MGNSFLEVDNFILAYNRLQTYMGDYYKRIYINDLSNFGLHLNTNIETLIDRIQRGLYRPGNANKIYIPKSDGTVRPITVLSFIDLLVYQAIINTLADTLYKDFKYKTNTYVFGNIYNDSKREEDQIFFYIPWKEQWRKYNYISTKYFREGFKYKCEFDLASFYDTIDHSILVNFMKEKIEDEGLVYILKNQLKHWSCDYDRVNIQKSHGIPQGPKSSGFLAEIVLNYIDEKMIEYVKKNPRIKYMRYVDDIRLFALNEDCGRRALAYLDLLSRDLGLIPQSSKLGIKLVKNVGEILKDNKNMSEMAIYYKKNKSLKDSQNNRLVRQLKKELIQDRLKNKDYNKTVIKFSMYRIKADLDLKNILIENINYLYDCFDEICYYLSKHFLEDSVVKEFVDGMLTRNDIPYNYIIAIIFKYFAEIIEYDEEIYNKYYKGHGSRNWYVRYFMLDWIYLKGPEIFSVILEDDNHIVRRKLKYFRYKNLKCEQAKKLIIKEAMIDEDIELALVGHSLGFMDFININISDFDLGLNEFIKRIYDLPVSENYINMILAESYKLENGHYFFSNNYWDDDELDNISNIFKNANTIIENDTSIWLNYINTFNHLITVRLLEMNEYSGFNKTEYNNILNLDNFISERFPKTYENFSKINERRNQIPSSHPYDRDGKIGRHLTKAEKIKYKDYFKVAMEEILIEFEGESSLKSNMIAAINI